MKRGINSTTIGIIVLVIAVVGVAVAYYGFGQNMIYYSPISCSLAEYISSDYDDDGIPAICNADGSGNDNCPTVKNSGQQNSNGKGAGDACEACPSGSNIDGDSYCDDVDPNPNIAKDWKTVKVAVIKILPKVASSPSVSRTPSAYSGYAQASPSASSTPSFAYSSPSPSGSGYP